MIPGHLQDGERIMKRLGVITGIVVSGLSLSGCQFGVEERPSVAMATAKTEQAAVAATTLPKPIYRVGDEWEYSDGYAIKVVEVGANGNAKFQRLDTENQWFVRKAFFKEESKSRKIRRLVVYRTADPMALLSARQKQPVVFIREYMRNGELVRHRTSWVIEGKEKITVPGGTFDTWVIVMRTQSLTGNWRGFERWYYSPEINGYVRLEFKYGEAPDGSRVLMSYSKAK